MPPKKITERAVTKADVETYPVVLWDESDPRSMINIAPKPVREAMLRAFKEKPELFDMDERELRKEVLPTPTDNRLRLAFWNEYNQAQMNMHKIRSEYVWGGICSHNAFFGRYLQRPDRVAWLLCPPASYVTIMEEALMFGIDQLRDMLELPVLNPKNGKLDVKLGELKAKIVAMLDMRVKGAVTQKSVNVNLNSSDATEIRHLGEAQTMEVIDKRLKELEARENMNRRTEERFGKKKEEQEVEAEIIT